MSFFPHRRTLEPAYVDALAETRAALSATCSRLVNCSNGRLPGRAVGSLCELQRATDQLQLASPITKDRLLGQLVAALHELQDDVAELARRGGPGEAILESRGLQRAERALARLAA